MYNDRNEANQCTDNSTHNVIAEDTVQIISTDTLQLSQILENQKMLFDKVDKILQLQAIALETQQKIVQKLATQSLQIEEISEQVANMKENPTVTLLKDANPVDTESFSLKPIENQRELICLDQSLADTAQRKKLQRQLSFLFSASNGQGKTCAYKLLDVLFNRDFLCNCSWAGGSRGDRSKIAIKDYKNVLKFFQALISTWDPTYTASDNEAFFKIILKNSKQRQAMKNIRTSTKRCRRTKKQTTGEKEKINLTINNDDDNVEDKTEEEKEKENVSVNNMTDINMSNDDGLEDGLC